MDLPFKVCPQCGVEYVHTALMCTDCGVSLDASGDRPFELESTPDPLPATSELQRIAAGSPWEMERLALELQQEGISSRIETVPTGPPNDREAARSSRRSSAGLNIRVGLYVAPQEAESAERIIRQLILPHEADALEHSPPGAELDACPACGAAISDAATACTDCGLEFVSVEDL